MSSKDLVATGKFVEKSSLCQLMCSKSQEELERKRANRRSIQRHKGNENYA